MTAIQRIQQKLQEIPESSKIVLEWRNIKTTISQAEGESLGKNKALKKVKSRIEKFSL